MSRLTIVGKLQRYVLKFALVAVVVVVVVVVVVFVTRSMITHEEQV